METFGHNPNWRNSVLERLEWLTDVIEAFDRTEERTALRSAPRRSLEYAVLLQGQAAARLEAALWGGPAPQWLLPIWTDPQLLAAELPSGATSIPATTAGYDFADGGQAVLWRDDATHEAVTIDTVTADALTLASPTTTTWAAGARLYPARPARLSPEIRLARPTAGILRGVLSFELEPASYPAAPDATLYRGVEVNTRSPNRIPDVPTGYDSKAERIDYALGAVAVDDLAGLPALRRSYEYLLRDRAAIAAWRGWLHARTGRAAAFWHPQWQLDLEQTAGLAAAGTVLHVRAGAAARYALAPGRQDLALLHADGTWYFRRILSATPAGDEELLELDAALGIDTQPGDFRLITYLTLVRLEADAIEIAWHTAGIAKSTVEYRSLRA